MEFNLVHMANHLDASTNERSINYVLLGKPHQERRVRHPTYMEMIKKALKSINEGRGSSKVEILKFIAENYHITEQLPMIKNHLHGVLDKALNNGEIEQSMTSRFRIRSIKSNKDIERERMLQLMVPSDSEPVMMITQVKTKNSSGNKKRKAIGKKRGQAKKSSTPRVKNVSTEKNKVKKAKVTRPTYPSLSMTLRNGTVKSSN